MQLRQAIKQMSDSITSVSYTHLLEMVCKIDRSFYYLHMEAEVAEEQLSEYESALRKPTRRTRKEM